MIDFFWVLLPYICILSVAVSLSILFDIPSHLSPVISICSFIVILFLTGILGLLPVGGALLYILGALALGHCIYALFLRKKKPQLDNFINVGFLGFVVLSLYIIILFSVRQPLFYEWDEFSFWGTAAKLTSMTDMLYSVSPGNLVGSTQSPALILGAYFFNFFGEFAPHRTYIAYDILLFSVGGAVAGCFGKKRWHYGIATFVLFFSLPYFVALFHGKAIYVSSVYMSAYADLPMGVLFAGALGVYFAGRQNSRFAVLAAALMLFVLTMCKETGLAFGLICGGIIAADTVLFAEGKLVGRLVSAVSVFATPIVAFILWSVHLSAAAGVDRSQVGGEQNMGTVQMLTTGVSELFGERSVKFDTVFTNLWQAFLHTRISVVGPGVVVAVLSCAMMLAVIVLTQSKKERLRAVLLSLLLILGCAVYTCFIGFTYAYVFKGEQGTSLISYDRYLSPYYMAWFGGTFVYALYTLRKGCRLSAFAAPSLMVAAFALFGYIQYLLPPDYSFAGYPQTHFAQQRDINARAQIIKSSVEQDANIFYFNEFDDGGGWFRNYYYLLPLHLDYSQGGSLDRFDAQSLAQYVVDNEIDYLYIDGADVGARERFGDMFSDNLNGHTEQAVIIYSVEIQGDEVLFHPTPIKDVEVTH